MGGDGTKWIMKIGLLRAIRVVQNIFVASTCSRGQSPFRRQEWLQSSKGTRPHVLNKQSRRVGIGVAIEEASDEVARSAILFERKCQWN